MQMANEGGCGQQWCVKKVFSLGLYANQCGWSRPRGRCRAHTKSCACAASIMEKRRLTVLILETSW